MNVLTPSQLKCYLPPTVSRLALCTLVHYLSSCSCFPPISRHHSVFSTLLICGLVCYPASLLRIRCRGMGSVYPHSQQHLQDLQWHQAHAKHVTNTCKINIGLASGQSMCNQCVCGGGSSIVAQVLIIISHTSSWVLHSSALILVSLAILSFALVLKAFLLFFTHL